MLSNLLWLAYLGNSADSVSLANLDAMAQRRDVEGLSKLLAPLPAGVRNPFAVLRTGGAYEVGRFGWHAFDLASATGSDRYVVVGTPLTSEDVGEILLRREGDRLRFVPEADALGVEIRGHRFDVRYDISAKRADIVDDLKLEFAAGARHDFIFRMSPAYQVEKILDGQKAVAFQQASGVVSVARPTANAATLTVVYHATVDLPRYAGSISSDEATLVNDYWYPMIAREPSPYEITIHSPKGWISVAQGAKLSEFETATERVTRYRMDLPVTYFSTISAPFATVSIVADGRTYTTWSARMSLDQMRAQDELYADIFGFYARSFGKPPYPQFGAVDSKTYGGGALEAYSFATYGGGLPSEDAHEPSHTWWGGLIDNTYLGSFWNESFADFSDGLYHREVPIGNRAERRQAFVSDSSPDPRYSEAAMAKSGADIGPVASALGYGKGAKVLQMLEQMLGPEKMIATMREWVATQPRGKPGDWEDFERVVMRLNQGAQVKEFLADWVHRRGYANFDVKANWQDGKVRFRVAWTGPRFHMPLAVMLQFDGGRREFYQVWLDGQDAPLELPAATKPELVSFDPWRQALRRQLDDEAPMNLSSAMDGLTKVVDPAHKDWLPRTGGQGNDQTVTDPAGLFLVGSPDTMPAMAPLCAKAGFVVKGNRLTYDGTTIDLDHGCALAVVDLPGGKRCVIGLGKTRLRPRFGQARLILTDDLGRFLRGKTEPKARGFLTTRF